MVSNDNRGTRIPIRRGDMGRKRRDSSEPVAQTAGDDVEHVDASAQTPLEQQTEDVAVAAAAAETQADVAAADVDWRETALRLKAEMENYRKRQKRWAEDEVLREQEQFLRPFLGVVDDLEQALKHIDLANSAHQGVRVVYDGVMTLLLHQGVERIAAEGQLFDPHFHEAVAVIPAQEAGVEDMHVVAVTLPGYMYAERVLRPAKVVVAKQGS